MLRRLGRMTTTPAAPDVYEVHVDLDVPTPVRR
jgi:hypothetical protein